MFKTLLVFICSVFTTTVITSIVSSQLVLADIQSFGLEVSFSERLSVTIKDILGLGPALILLIGLSFLVAFIIAKYAHRFMAGNRTIWYTIAGLSSFPVTLYIAKYFMGVTILASARTSPGMVLIACCCAVGGWLFAVLSSKYGAIKNV